MKTIIALMRLFIIGMTNAVIELEEISRQAGSHALLALAWLCALIVTVYFIVKGKDYEF